MAEYLHPGVYVEEIERGPRPIEGVPTSTAAMLGATERGPLHPRLVTSFVEYTRWFGGEFGTDNFLPCAARGFFENGGKRLIVCRVVDCAATTAQAVIGDYAVMALGPGAWGQRLWVKVTASSTRNGSNVPVGFRLRVALFDAGTVPRDCFDAARAPQPVLVEDHDDLVLDPASPDYFVRRLGVDRAEESRASALVSFVHVNTATSQPPADFNGTLDGGTGGAALVAADFGRALSALEDSAGREVALVYAPAADAATQRTLVEHCEKSRFRFAVLDAPRAADPATLEPRIRIADTSYAAFYSPWLVIEDSGTRRLVPPGGHVLGIYARADLERGAFKAPANEVVRGALDLEFTIDDRQQETLTPGGINAIRHFPGRGIRVWGARTLASDSTWKYVNVRRLFIYLEHSIWQGMQWVVFEPNDERLWARVTDTIRNFLNGQWRSGALQGQTEDEAFFVKCDRSTMTQVDILEGRLICVIGIAPVRPAEFVILQIGWNLASP